MPMDDSLASHQTRKCPSPTAILGVRSGATSPRSGEVFVQVVFPAKSIGLRIRVHLLVDGFGTPPNILLIRSPGPTFRWFTDGVE